VPDFSRGKRVLAALRRRLSRKKDTSAHFQAVVDLAARSDANRAHALRDSATPLISFVVPVYDTKPEYLTALLASFVQQPKALCELILSDDGSSNPATKLWLDARGKIPGVTIIRNKDNGGIARATNAGIRSARGIWIGLVDHDDALAPFAARRIAEALDCNPGAQFLYTDEVVTDGDLRPTDYFLKPAWDPVLLSGVNYVNHLSLYRRGRLLEIGGFREGFDGSQDYDLLLRYTKGLKWDEFVHVPYPAYLWRRDGATFSAKFLEAATTNARQALADAYDSSGHIRVGPADLRDLHRIRFDEQKSDWPLVSIIVPSRDGFELIARTLSGLTDATDYPNFELIVVDNGSVDPRVLALYDMYQDRPSPPFFAHIEEAPFNFSRSVNLGAARAGGEFILLLNNDIEITDPNWLKEMVSCFAYPDTGIVGAKLLYPNRTLQHAGVIAGLGDLAGHWFVGERADYPGPLGRLAVRQTMSVVTGACMLISRKCLERVGPFDEEQFAIAYNDVDFCLRAVSLGVRIVWTPFATLVHHESASRGSDETEQNIGRFRREQDNLRRRHHTDTIQDRAFNPWYSRDRSNPVPVRLGKLPDARR
jgi:GT2 family glycosyltransferase